jgi:hypothetical protein
MGGHDWKALEYSIIIEYNCRNYSAKSACEALEKDGMHRSLDAVRSKLSELKRMPDLFDHNQKAWNMGRVHTLLQHMEKKEQQKLGRDELLGELRKEMQVLIKRELAEGLKEPIRRELETGLKEQIRREVEEGLKEHIKREVEDRVKQQTRRRPEKQTETIDTETINTETIDMGTHVWLYSRYRLHVPNEDFSLTKASGNKRIKLMHDPTHDLSEPNRSDPIELTMVRQIIH